MWPFLFQVHGTLPKQSEKNYLWEKCQLFWCRRCTSPSACSSSQCQTDRYPYQSCKESILLVPGGFQSYLFARFSFQPLGITDRAMLTAFKGVIETECLTTVYHLKALFSIKVLVPLVVTYIGFGIKIPTNCGLFLCHFFQHQRSHDDKVALQHTFLEVVSADDDASHHLRELRNRCLDPGMYAVHLEHWLSYYSPSQVLNTELPYQ